MSNYIPNLEEIRLIEQSFAGLLNELSNQSRAARSSLLKYFVSVVTAANSVGKKQYKQLHVKSGKHVVVPISEDYFKRETIWGRTGIVDFLNEALSRALGSSRLGLDMLISRIPNGTPVEGFGSLTLAPPHFSPSQEDDLRQKFDDSSFVFPSSLFLLGDLGGGRTEAALPVFMLSGNFGRTIFDIRTLWRKSVGLNLIAEDLSGERVVVEGEKWLEGTIHVTGQTIALKNLYKEILHSYKFWTGYSHGVARNPSKQDIFGILFMPSGNDYRSRTALLCPVTLCLDSNHLVEFVENVSSIARCISLVIKLLGGILEKYLAHAVEGLANESLLLANTHSAIGSIMARNGSHNIGSHVLSALSHNVGTMPDDRMLYQYIQHRMDYIASATTGAPDWSVPTPFVGNAMKLFYSQRHLLDHIAESDGLHAYQYQGKGTQIGAGQKDCVKIVVRKIERYKEGEQPKREKGDGWQRKAYPDKKHPNEKISIDAYEFFSDVTEGTNWDLDEAVSIPGGILGQHAFYNIVENVLRNAAKHSWAGQEEKDAGNLEIYIDFEKRQEEAQKEWMCFTVGDNMSKLFSSKCKFWEEFFKTFPSTVADFANPLDGNSLDGFIVSPDEESKRAALAHFLDGTDHSVLPDSLSHYQLLHEYVIKHWDVLRTNKDFLALLQGKDPNSPKTPNKELGHRLPLPLHHRQEIALANPFIDLETNRLRQAAWGLSEMKISAGYLRRAEVSVIGGLKPDVGKLPLIVPIGIPSREEAGDQSGGSDGNAGKVNELSYKDLCLAYRFWVKLPKDVLIVADDKVDGKVSTSPFDVWNEKVKDWDGVDVQPYVKVLGAEGDIGKMSDYSFVLVDHAGDSADDDKLKLPFRALLVDGSEDQPCAARKKLEEAATAKDFVMCVYCAWLDYLKKRRGEKAKHRLNIKLNIYEKEGGEKGLISDRDIYKVLFRECLHSILEPLALNDELPELQQKALLLVSLYPLDEDDPLFEDVEEKVEEGRHLSKMNHLLGSISGRVLRFWTSLPCASEKDCDKWEKLLDAYRAGLERARANWRVEAIPNALLEELNAVHNNVAHAADSALLQELEAMSEEPSRSPLVELAAGAMDVARATSDVFLRKYEERIVTLPHQYKGVAKPQSPILKFEDFGVAITYGAAGGADKADISYNRHSRDDAPLYSEPLSGSQTYLNALSDLTGDDALWAMRLAENGLLRIVIIDERVRAFIADHGEEIRKTYESMHLAVVDTTKPPRFDANGILPEFKDWDYVAGASGDFDFDLIIIHQGVIDKWWADHSKKKVAEILGELRKRKGGQKGEPQNRFVVVTTGRGRPDNIPENEKVLAFSAIEAFLFKRYPEKLNLVNALMNILPGSPERNDNND